MPTEREMRETKAAQQCLTFMIQHCRSVFLAAETCPEDRLAMRCPALTTCGPREIVFAEYKPPTTLRCSENLASMGHGLIS